MVPMPAPKPWLTPKERTAICRRASNEELRFDMRWSQSKDWRCAAYGVLRERRLSASKGR